MIKITMEVHGMMCGHCEAHMNDVLRNTFSISKVTSSSTKRETVILTETDIPEQALQDAVKQAGYELRSVTKTEQKKGLFSAFKK